jgi:hypothetical protein
MKQFSTAELQQMAQALFGRQLSERKIQAYRGRLPTMLRTAGIIKDWESGLRDIEPAAVHAVPVTQPKADDAD